MNLETPLRQMLEIEFILHLAKGKPGDGKKWNVLGTLSWTAILFDGQL